MGMKPGDDVIVSLAKKQIEGTLLESHDADAVLIKLGSGYNIGIPKENVFDMSVTKKSSRKKDVAREPEKTQDGDKPTIGLVITGGTIASKLDPRTGGVTPLTDLAEFRRFYPELFKTYNVKAIETPFMIDSSAMDAKRWIVLAETTKQLLDDSDIEGVIVTHGTDTLHYTAAALSFFLPDLNKPVVLTYSQRSIDRASSDATLNLQCAAHAATSDLAEVVLVGHASTNDDYCYLFRGTKVRKLHTSRRDAFKAVNTQPLAKIQADGTIDFMMERRPRTKEKPRVDAVFNEKVAIVKFYPGQNPDILDFYRVQGYKGIILEVLGMGQIGGSDATKSWNATLKKTISSGVSVCAVAQCVHGRLNQHVYSAGRELAEVGVLFLGDMLAETAYVKLGWVLGHTNWRDSKKVREKMSENIAGEYNALLSL